jgi:MoaA/NifB/PqqE/SkfB family radical SAM enzyme
VREMSISQYESRSAIEYDFFSPDFTIQGLTPDVLSNKIEDLRKLKAIPQYLTGPLFVLWELSGKCCLHCRYCYNNSPSNVELTTEEALDLVDELDKLQVFSVCLSGGEPLLRKDLLTIMDALIERKIGVGMVTSGFGLTENLAKEISNRLSAIQISLDGPTKEVNDYLRGPGAFDTAIRAIKLFREYGKIEDIRISCLTTAYNIGFFEDMVKLCLKLGIRTLRTQPVIMTGRARKDKSLMVNPEDYEKLEQLIRSLNNSKNLQGKLSIQSGNPLLHIYYGIILGFTTFVRITPEGIYCISPYVNYAFGDIKSIKLSECWNKGLKVAWKHPDIVSRLSKVRSYLDIANLGEECEKYIYLDPEQALRV